MSPHVHTFYAIEFFDDRGNLEHSALFRDDDLTIALLATIASQRIKITQWAADTYLETVEAYRSPDNQRALGREE